MSSFYSFSFVEAVLRLPLSQLFCWSPLCLEVLRIALRIQLTPDEMSANQSWLQMELSSGTMERVSLLGHPEPDWRWARPAKCH